ncbi:MAG: ACT domain-containing protein [Bacteroidaceae bacterium]
MKETTYFPIEERRQIVSLYTKLRRLTPETFIDHKYYDLKSYIEQAISEEPLQPDLFGFNSIITSLEGALIAVNEIGIKGSAITAWLLQVATKENRIENIAHLFGQDVYSILHGLNRIGELYAKSPSIKSENFRNLLVSFAEDMRVILLIIADRVALMRRIKDSTEVDARYRAAEEAAYLYAPLSHKLGLYKLKSELEDLSLKYMEHDAYYHIKEKLNATKKARNEYIERFISPVNQHLSEAGLKFHIKGRTKSIHSIWQKMKKQQCSFDGVYDLFAIRIILDSKEKREKQDCWQAYSIVTDMYQPNPKRLRDWLSIPKSNGYESLHITVLGPEKKWVEVQIRTQRMDEIAEHGLAAHWRYKGVKSSETGIEDWLANIRGALENNDDLKLMDQFKTDLYEDELYVFTPKGDLFKLAKGATVLDFAYHIHSNIGNKCIGAMVNDKNVSLRYELASGDSVVVLTANNQNPKPDWLNIVKTSRAKSKIRQAIKEVQVKEVSFAKEQLERKFKNRKIELDESTLNHLVKKLGFKEQSDFFRNIGNETLDINEVIETYLYLYKKETNQLERATIISAENYNLSTEDERRTTEDNDVLVIDQSLKDIDYSLAKCCHPIYGDDVFGFVTVSGGIKIHRHSCPNAPALRERFSYRMVKAKWAGKGTNSNYPIMLRVIGNDDLGIINNITSIISKENNITLRSINIESNDGLFSGMLTIMVSDTRGLESLIKKLKAAKGVKNVSRS